MRASALRMKPFGLRPPRWLAVAVVALLAVTGLGVLPGVADAVQPIAGMNVRPAVGPAVVDFNSGSDTASTGAGCVSGSLAPCADLTMVTAGHAIVVILTSTAHGAVGPCANPALITDTSGDTYTFENDNLNGTGSVPSTLLYTAVFFNGNAKSGDHTISWAPASACSAADTFVGAYELSGASSISNQSAYHNEAANSTFTEKKAAVANQLLIFVTNAVRPNAGCDASGSTIGGGLGANNGQAGASSTRETYMSGVSSGSPGVNNANCVMPVSQVGMSYLFIVGAYVPPSPSFTEQPATGLQNHTSYFNASVSGGQGPFTYAWAFGDGGTSTAGASVTHIYTVAGTFTVRLVVTDSIPNSGYSNQSYTVTVFHGLVAVAVVHPTPPIVIGTTEAFQALIHGGKAPYNVRWGLGDGNTSTATFLNHTYSVVGNYSVVLNVTDANGTVYLDTNLTIRVTHVPPVPVLVVTSGDIVVLGALLLLLGSLGFYLYAGGKRRRRTKHMTTNR